MSEIYIYPPNCDDYTTIGLCGALMPTEAIFEEVGNGLSELTITHPLDRLGKYKTIQNDCVLSVEVPVRTTPEIDNGQYVTSVETYTVKASAATADRYIYNAATKGKKLKLISPRTKVTVVQKPVTGTRWKVKTATASGYMEAAALDVSTKETTTIPATADGIEAAVPAWRQRLQLFRIYLVEWSSDGNVRARARHISYDLIYDITLYQQTGAYTLQQALDGLMAQGVSKLPYYLYTNIRGTHTGALYRDQDPITAILDPEEGLAAKWNAKVVRDNNEVYLLDRAGMDRGVYIEYANNLTGVTMSADQSTICTRLRPIGENKDGTKLYLDTSLFPQGCVDSPLKDNYPIDRVLTITVNEAKVTKDVSVAVARTRMLEAARAEFEKGIDKPTISVAVEFALLGDTERYKQYRNLTGVYLYDTVHVYYPQLGIDIDVDVVRQRWDCLNDRMISIELGKLQAMTSSVSAWQISGGITGAKILEGSVGGGKISADAVAARHIQADSINAEKIQAGAVTAEKINAEEIKAGAGSFTELQAAIAEISAAYIEKLTAGDIESDRLAAAMARFGVITAGNAYFDEATVRHLISSALQVENAVGGKVTISNLAVDYASIVTAYVGNLCIKASDGNFYRLDVNAVGEIAPVLQSVTEAEEIAGQTASGAPIIETEMNVSDLSASNIRAAYALVNRIDAARIDVDTLSARQAFINVLQTADLVSNTTLNAYLTTHDTQIDDLGAWRDNITRWIHFDDDGLTQGKEGSIYSTLIDEKGFHIKKDGAINYVGSFDTEGLATDGVTIGRIKAKKTSKGGWAWQEVST